MVENDRVSSMAALQADAYLHCAFGVVRAAALKMTFEAPVFRSPAFSVYIPQRNAGVCSGASHSSSIVRSAALTVIEQPAISSDVT